MNFHVLSRLPPKTLQVYFFPVLNWEGVAPVSFLNTVLNDDLEL
jgi:hypothetical protein